MTETQKSKPQFVICINTDDPDMLTPRMINEHRILMICISPNPINGE